MDMKLFCRRLFIGMMPLFAGIGLFPARVQADSVSVSGIMYPEVKITKIEGNELFFDSPRGEEHKTIGPKLIISVDGEPGLTDAEKLWVAGKLPDAVDGYSKVMDSSSRPWAREWAARRLLDSAEKANRFDAAVNAWVVLVQKNSAVAEQKTPTIPAATSTYITTAIAKVKSAAGSATDSQKTMLLNFLLKLQTTAKDDAGASETAKLLQSVTMSPVGNSGASGNVAITQQARTSLNLASLELEKKNYKGALDGVQQNRQLYVDPAMQADALWIIAEAHNGMSGESKNAPELENAALDYMRLVAFFPDNAHAPSALLKSAALEERVGDKETRDQAVLLYQQVATQYKDRPEGQRAKEAVDRLKAAH